MTAPVACPPAPGPLEAYATHFDPLWRKIGQRRSFRAYLAGLLLPHDRAKTLTGLAGAEPIVQAQAGPVQRLQFFLSESPWDAQAINTRRLALLRADPATAPTVEGVLVSDETGDRKDGRATAHVARQYLGSVGTVANGIVAVSSLWADERVYYPLHVDPYTPAERLPQGKTDPAFRTKPQIAAGLVQTARASGIPFRAVVADCIYGESAAFGEVLWREKVPYVLSLRPATGTWGPAAAAQTPKEAATDLQWAGPDQPGEWGRVVRRVRDGHHDTWWAAELTLAGYGPDKPTRLVAAPTDPATLPERSTWYLETTLVRPGSPQEDCSLWPAADLAEMVRLYGVRQWVEQSYKQVTHELGWADFMVRSDAAIRRHWQLVCCAFSFCWWVLLHQPQAAPPPLPRPASRRPCADPRASGPLGRTPDGAGEKGAPFPASDRPVLSWPVALRHVRRWLDPWVMLQRYWCAWSSAPPPQPFKLFSMRWAQATASPSISDVNKVPT